MIENVGPAIAGLQDDRGDPVAEMKAFDQLGPMTRAIINDKMLVNWSAAKTLEYIRRMRGNPTDSRMDARMAGFLMQANAQIAAKIKVSA